MLKVTLPYPPSANAYWRNVHGRVLVSAEARAYKKQVALLVQWKRPMTCPIALVVHVHRPQRRGDLDNTLKVLCDSLNGLAWADDSQVVEIHAYRHEDKDNPRAEVEVRSLVVEGELKPIKMKGPTPQSRVRPMP